jgi:hypothetical protein
MMGLSALLCVLLPATPILAQQAGATATNTSLPTGVVTDDRARATITFEEAIAETDRGDGNGFEKAIAKAGRGDGNGFEEAIAEADRGNGNGRGFLTGDRGFQNFIGFMSNPQQNIDPRAVTELWPVFAGAWPSTSSFLPSGNMQVYGAGLYLALSERLSMGMNQGGYVVSEFDKTDLLGRRVSTTHDGWVNLGGFLQYTLIRDVENQGLLTSGLRWEAPTGESSVFQGHGPAYLAPYLTGGKEFGNFHFLATFGYEFPTGPGKATSNTFYGNVHLDRRTFGWLYPLIEFNASYHTTQVNFSDLDNRPGFFDFGTFSATGNIVTMAPGFNAVIIPNRVEFGAVYLTVLGSQRNFDMNGLLVKMVLRY